MKITALLALFATISFVNAQDPPPGDPDTRVLKLKYVIPSQISPLLNRISQYDDQLKILILHGPKSVMDQEEQFIRHFDVPPPPVQNVEVTIYIMSALGQPSAAAVPPELESVVKQLKSMFSYRGYQLIDAQAIRVRAGQGGEASGVVNMSPAIEPKTISQIKFKAASVSTDDKGRAIRIDGLRVGLRVPVSTNGGTQFQYLDTGINTDVDVHEGQKVVVGKANMDGSDRASIVVLTAKVVE